MRWTIQHVSTILIGLTPYRVVAEEDDGVALYINNEYVKDVDELPTYEELVELVEEQNRVNQLTEVEL